MAAWRDRLNRGTFRGVPFFVESAEVSGGRRTVTHEFPARDTPYVEDLGRKSRGFSVEVHVIGSEYMDARDKLFKALEERGPGELVHPYHGTKRVAVDSFRVRETTAEGGIATFSITFIEAETEAKSSSATRASRSKLKSTASVVAGVVRQVAERAESPGLPVASTLNLATIVTAAATALDICLSPIVVALQEAAALRRSANDIRSRALSLVASPADLMDEFLGLLDALPTMPARAGIVALLKARGFEPTGERPAAATTTGEVEQSLYDIVGAVARGSMLLHAARLAADAEWDSYQDAVEVRDEIAEAIDEEAEFAGDEIYGQLQQLRSDLVLAVPGEDSDLPRLVQYTPPATVPSVVLVHRLYGDLSREQDVVVRNSVRNPGFVLGGVALEVLSDA